MMPAGYGDWELSGWNPSVDPRRVPGGRQRRRWDTATRLLRLQRRVLTRAREASARPPRTRREPPVGRETRTIHHDMSTPASSDTSAAALKAPLSQARDELVELTRRAFGGFVALTAYSSRLDEVLTRIHGAAAVHTETPHALIAVGGYGRKHMCLHSDVDLLIVFDGTIGAAEERAIKAVLHPLWDLRLDVGHHIRELTETAVVDTDNPEYLVALCDARFVAGDRKVFERFSQVCLKPGRAREEATLQALLDLMKQRHQQFQGTLYQLEPDVKDTPGALRDVTAARLIERLTRRERPQGPQADRLREAEDFMLRIRSILHLERGRNLNVLTHELQDTVASVFGSPGDSSGARVEALMSTYFHHARIISRALDVARKSSSPPPTGETTPLGNGLVRDRETRSRSPTAHWPRSSRRRGSAPSRPRSRRAAPCLGAGPDLRGASRRPVLTGALLPDHGRARLPAPHAAPPAGSLRGALGHARQRSAGAHVSRSSRRSTASSSGTSTTSTRSTSTRCGPSAASRRLCEPATRSRRRFGGILKELERPELLVVALLFHDVGKWTNKNHCEEGVRMAEGALRRISLDEPDIATVSFLIRHHLQMSMAAFRRDTDDPTVVEQFAKIVGTEERLKLLCLLTLVDVEAVGPDVMTPWKEDLLWRLYVDTYNRLTLGYGDEVIDTATPSLETPARGSSVRHRGPRAGDVPRGPSPTLSSLRRRRAHLCPRPARPGPGPERREVRPGRHGLGLGAHRRLGRPSEALRARSAGCCPTSAWTSCAGRPCRTLRGWPSTCFSSPMPRTTSSSTRPGPRS